MTGPAVRLLIVSEMTAQRRPDRVLVDEGHLRRFADYGPDVALTWTIAERADAGSLDTPLPDEIGIAWLPGFASSRQFVSRLPATWRALWHAVGEADAVLVNVPSFPALPALAIARLRRRPALALQVARWAQLRVGPGSDAADTPATRLLGLVTALLATVMLVHGDTLVAEVPRWARRKVEPVTLSSLDERDIATTLAPWSPTAGTVRLVTLTRLIRTKRVDALLDTVTLLRRDGIDATLVVAGDGPERPDIEARIAAANLGDAVTLLGWIDDSAVLHHHLRAADAFVFASEDEGLPLSVMEAMAIGTPVVSTPAGGLATFLQDGRDSLVVSPDAAVIQLAVMRLLGDPELAESLRRNAVEKVRPLTRQAFVSHLVEVVLVQSGATPR